MNPDYQILAPLGEDGRFELLSARRVRTGAPVLLRRARPELAASASVVLAALQRECGLAGASPGAATLLPRVIDAPPPALLVMEDPGGELLGLRLARGPLSVGTALAVGLHIGGALAELHRRGLLHNGLRPGAILCGPDEAQAWLVDFADAGPLGTQAAQRDGGTAAGAPDLSVARADRPHRARRRRAQRPLRAGHRAVRDADRRAAVPLRRSARADPLAHRRSCAARRPRLDAAHPRAAVGDRDEADRASVPDDRYQSAAALVQDLTHCSLALGRARAHRAVRARPARPRRAPGRSRSACTAASASCIVLLEAFERACAGQAGRSMLLVEGYSGIGKTALIQELVRPIVRRKGYFIVGQVRPGGARRALRCADPGLPRAGAPAAHRKRAAARALARRAGSRRWASTAACSPR